MWLRWFDQYCQYTGILHIVRRVYHMQQVFFCYCCLTLSIEIDDVVNWNWGTVNWNWGTALKEARFNRDNVIKGTLSETSSETKHLMFLEQVKQTWSTLEVFWLYMPLILYWFFKRTFAHTIINTVFTSFFLCFSMTSLVLCTCHE